MTAALDRHAAVAETALATTDLTANVAGRAPDDATAEPGRRDGAAPPLRFDANLSILFGDRPLLERPALAVQAGFDAVEMWWPFQGSVPGPGEMDRLVASIADEGLSLVLLNLCSGSLEAGEHGLLALPDQRAQFRENVDAAVEITARLGGRVLNALYGNIGSGMPKAQRQATAVENLAYAAQRAATVGARVVLEPLNAIDFPHYGLRTIEDAIALAARARAEAGVDVDILFDVYNIQRTQGDLIRRIDAYAHRFGHVQIADVPDRLRPGTGEIAFDRVFGALECAGYRRFVGLEYRPSRDPDDTFAWLPRERRRSGAGKRPRRTTDRAGRN
jgi:hydroxypyruvate isomerase